MILSHPVLKLARSILRENTLKVPISLTGPIWGPVLERYLGLPIQALQVSRKDKIILVFSPQPATHKDIIALPGSQRRKPRLQVTRAWKSLLGAPSRRTSPRAIISPTIAVKAHIEPGKSKSDESEDGLLGQEPARAEMLPAAKGFEARTPGQLFTTQEPLRIEGGNVVTPDALIVVQEPVRHHDVAAFLEDFAAYFRWCGDVAHERIGRVYAEDFMEDGLESRAVLNKVRDIRCIINDAAGCFVSDGLEKRRSVE